MLENKSMFILRKGEIGDKTEVIGAPRLNYRVRSKRSTKVTTYWGMSNMIIVSRHFPVSKRQN